MWIPFATPATLIQDILRSWKRYAEGFAHPFNRFEWEDDTTWWIAPAPEQPTYKYTKILVGASSKWLPWIPGNHLFVGVHVERGLGPQVLDDYPAWENKVMEPGWTWHDFCRDVRAGRLVSTIKTAAQQTGSALEIHVLAGVPVKDPRDYRRDLIQFVCEDGHSIKPSAAPMIQTADAFLRSAGTSTSLPELIEYLVAIAHPWLWIDLCLGHTLSTMPRSGEPATPIDALVDQSLKPFRTWLVRLSA